MEQAFFQRWYAEQDDPTRGLVRQLVADGQLEFVNGGWCMHDEANPSYVDMIDQTALGHRWIMQEFGVAPKVTWQVRGTTSTETGALAIRQWSTEST